MKRMTEAYSPENSPVQIIEFDCHYQQGRDSTTFATGRPDGIFSAVNFSVVAPGNADLKGWGIEAVEFNFILLDMFDNFMGSIQGVAGPGKYPAGRKKHRAKWIFSIDGAFSQYHAVCFPSQARMLDGSIWRCDRISVVDRINGLLGECGLILDVADVFPDGIASVSSGDEE